MREIKFYTAKEVKELLRIKANSTLYNMARRGDIPAPIKVSGQVGLWNKKKLDSFLKLTDNEEAA